MLSKFRVFVINHFGFPDKSGFTLRSSPASGIYATLRPATLVRVGRKLSVMAENSILDELKYDAASGALTYREVRYLLIRPETIVGFQKTIEKHSRTGAQDALFQGGYRGGVSVDQKIQRNAEPFRQSNHQLYDDHGS